MTELGNIEREGISEANQPIFWEHVTWRRCRSLFSNKQHLRRNVPNIVPKREKEGDEHQSLGSQVNSAPVAPRRMAGEPPAPGDRINDDGVKPCPEHSLPPAYLRHAPKETISTYTSRTFRNNLNNTTSALQCTTPHADLGALHEQGR
ncbi:hypothetical protein ECG_08807 [Echinococcus granulosus]|nr:hypothetical protein ECG_08807 [Echinococcus granulosus]